MSEKNTEIVPGSPKNRRCSWKNAALGKANIGNGQSASIHDTPIENKNVR